MIRVVILCQGKQTRMEGLSHPKQLLGLHCPKNGRTITILERTCRQVRHHMGPDVHITVVADQVKFASAIDYCDRVVDLVNPGNSSLKGLHRYLASGYAAGHRDDATLVLLGDVVYSNGDMGLITTSELSALSFLTTHDLSPSDGELFAVWWPARDHRVVMDTLDDAMQKHPPFHDTYQPGQMRRLLWAARERSDRRNMYQFNSYAYTRDFDTTEQLIHLASIADSAWVDDIEQEMPWTR